MSAMGDAFAALKSVVLIQDRVERMHSDLETTAKDLSRLKDFVHQIDKRLYAIERIVDLGSRQARQPRLEE